MVILILLGGFFAAAVSFAERYMLSVSVFNIKAGKAMDGLKGPVAVISDLHCVSFGKNNERLISRILSFNPCMLIIAGDLITGTVTKRQHVALDLLKELAGHVPVYYGFGNHERRAEEFRGPGFYTDKVREIEGVTVLRNDYASVEGTGIRIYGFDQPSKCYKDRRVSARMLERRLGAADSETYNILIAHDPEHFKAYAKWGADLVLAGHNHGGIVRLPLLGGVISPRRKLFPKYDSGVFRRGKTTMLVSRGLGSHTIPIRVFNRPEIMLIYPGEN